MKRRAALKTLDYQGIALAIDRPQGTVFGGTDANGNPYSVTQQDDYGFIVGVVGDDGEEYDVYVGASALAASVYVVRQLKSGQYDEQKAMLGYDSAEQAEALYRAHTAPAMFGGMFAVSIAEFKRQLAARGDGPFVADDTLPREQASMTDATKEPASARTDGERPGGLCVRAAHVSSVRPDEREAEFVCSTEAIDSYGEIVRQTWDLKRFSLNPVALWSHSSHDLPVGQWKQVRVEGGALVAVFKAASAAANPVAENAWQSIVEGSLRTVSVGFVSHKTTVEEIDGKEVVVLDDNELFEISLTPLPANPEAVVRMRTKALDEYRARRDADALTARGAVPFVEHPITDAKWDRSAATKRLRAWASDGSSDVSRMDWNKYRSAFAHVDTKRAHEFGGYSYPHHDVADGKLTTPRAAVVAACAAFQRAAGSKIPEAERAAVKMHLQRSAHQHDMQAPWETPKSDSPVVAAAVDTLKTTQPHAGTKNREARVAGTKDDETEAAKTKSMVTCPECGEQFDPEDEGDDKSKSAHVVKFRAYMARATAALVAGSDALKAKLHDVTSERDALTTKHSSAMADLASSKSREDALALKLVETELTPLSGVKYAPSAHEGHVDLAKHYLSQGIDGAAKWQKHIDGLKGAPSLVVLGGSVLPKDPTPSGLRTNAADAGESGADIINSMAQAS